MKRGTLLAALHRSSPAADTHPAGLTARSPCRVRLHDGLSNDSPVAALPCQREPDCALCSGGRPTGLFALCEARNSKFKPALRGNVESERYPHLSSFQRRRESMLSRLRWDDGTLAAGTLHGYSVTFLNSELLV